MKDRSVFRDLINKIEADYPVNEWIHNGYHIWPILRIRLFMMMVRQYEGSRHNQSKGNGLFESISEKIRNIPLEWLGYINLNKEIDTLYCGAPSHRVNYLGKNYNRYFDNLMDKEDKNDLLIEYSATSKKNYYKPERVLLVSDLIKFFKLYRKLNDIRGRENKFAEELNLIVQKSGFEVQNFVSQTSRQITNVDRSIEFFSKLLSKTSPQKIYELCYYSTDILGLNIVADRMGIPTIDIQHGPQGRYHLAYGSWQYIPENGFEVLPDKFHTWDQSSANAINKWADETIKHSAVVTGNPWVEGWKKGEFKSIDYQWPDNLILYTLQPTGDPLEPYMLETIKKTCSKWNWWLRIHPRQMGEIASLKKKLIEFELLDHVNIEDATELQLPEMLVNTKVHITKFSGCAIEAFNFGIPTILLDRRGEDIFEDYFEYEIMSSCIVKASDQLIDKINSYIV